MRYGLTCGFLLVLAPGLAMALSNNSGLTMDQSKMVYESTLASCKENALKDAYFVVETSIQKMDVAQIYCDCLAGGGDQLIKADDMDYLARHNQMSPGMQIAFQKHTNGCMKQMKADVKAIKAQQRLK